MQTRTVTHAYGAVAALCLAGSMPNAAHAASLMTERSVAHTETQAVVHAPARSVGVAQEWRLVIRLWSATANRHGPVHVRWVVNTYPSNLDCQHALQRRVNGIHPEVKRRSRLVCVPG